MEDATTEEGTPPDHGVASLEQLEQRAAAVSERSTSSVDGRPSDNTHDLGAQTELVRLTCTDSVDNEVLGDETPVDRITREGFEIVLYGKLRFGKARGDLVSCNGERS